MLATGLAIGDATTLSKDRVVKTHSDYSVELRRAKRLEWQCRAPFRTTLRRQFWRSTVTRHSVPARATRKTSPRIGGTSTPRFSKPLVLRGIRTSSVTPQPRGFW